MPLPTKRKYALAPERHQEVQASTIKTSGSSWFEVPSAQLRKNMFFKPAVDQDYELNIIPYVVKTNKHPLVKSGKLHIGDLDYLIDVYVHKYVLPLKKDFICLNKTFSDGSPCCICEERSKLYEAGREEDAKSMYASRRALLNVQLIKDGVPQKEVLIWEVPFNSFVEKVSSLATKANRSGPPIRYADPVEGKVISFSTKAGKLPKSLEYESFQFFDRTEEVTDEIIEKAISLDACLNMLTAQEVSDIYYGKVDIREGTDEPTDAESKAHAAVRTQMAKKVVAVEVDESEGEGPMESDEEVPKPAKDTSGSGHKCPYGHSFGNDNDKKDDCSKCRLWEDCYAEHEQ